MKRTKKYVTLPGYITIPKAAELMASKLKDDHTDDDIKYFYRLIKSKIDRGSIKVEVIGPSGRVKQVKEDDITELAFKYQRDFKSNDSIELPAISNFNKNTDSAIKEIASVVQLCESGRIGSNQAYIIIKDIVKD